MAFYSDNAFYGGGYAHAKREGALVRGSEAPLYEAVQELKYRLESCSAIIVGAGAGLSTAAGLGYSGKRFASNFADFQDRFGITDMYSGGFYPFPDLETYWAWWSRHIKLNRYDAGPAELYLRLFELLQDKNYFVITTNVDHQFQLAGFDKQRLFYTQGDYGLLQCANNCSNEVVRNEALVYEMVERQRNMRVPSELVPVCPHCGSSMVPNLRVDNNFCEPRGWHEAARRYSDFCERHNDGRVLYLELGVGGNTPVIIKYPFWRAVAQNADSTYACLNLGESYAPSRISERSILIDADINRVVASLEQ